MSSRSNKPFSQYAAARRVQLLTMLAEGHTVDAVARQLHISERTVRRTVRSLCDQTGCRSAAHLVAWAVTNQLITPAVPSAEAASPALCRGHVADGCQGDDDAHHTGAAR